MTSASGRQWAIAVGSALFVASTDESATLLKIFEGRYQRRHTNSMKKTPLLIGLVMVSAVAGGSFAYGWYSVNKLPDRAQTTDVARPAAGTSAANLSLYTAPGAAGLTDRPGSHLFTSSPSDNGQISLTLDEAQLNQLVNDAIASQPQAAPVLAKVRSLHTTFKEDTIETGAVLNLSELPTLSAELQTGLDQLTRAVPMLANRGQTWYKMF